MHYTVVRMLLKDIQHLETCVGGNVTIFYLALFMAISGMVSQIILPEFYPNAGLPSLAFALLLLIWCDTNFSF